MTENPYATKTGHGYASNATNNISEVYRDGQLLVARINTSLPKYCLWNNEPTNRTVKVCQVWQPAFVYWSVVLGIIPYLFLSPIFARKVCLAVPIGNARYRYEMKWVYAGLGLTAIGFILLASTLVAWKSDYQNLHGFDESVLVSLIWLGILLFVVGLFCASRRIGKVKIFEVKGGYIYVEKVHPGYLDRLPELEGYKMTCGLHAFYKERKQRLRRGLQRRPLKG